MKTVCLLLFTFASIAVQSQQTGSGFRIAGHRGGYYDQYPESSLSLFQFIAKEFAPDTIMVEVDLRKSKDGTIYILHDETLDRTTTGAGRIDQLDDRYLNNLYLKKANGEATAERMLTFVALLDAIENRNINLMLDIKTLIHAEVYGIVKQRKMESRMLTLTFNMDLTKKVAGLSGEISLSALIESEQDWQKFQEIPMGARKKIAYTNSKTPAALIHELSRNGVFVMADVSEAIRNSGRPLSGNGYQNKVYQNMLDILITDFPIEARQSFLRK